MTFAAKGPSPGGEDSPLELSSLGGIDLRSGNPKASPSQAKISRNPRAVREAKFELLREAMFEACGFIRFYAEVCQGQAEAGDNVGLIHSIGRLVAYTKEAARNGADLRAILDEAASNKDGGR